ncbi:MAG: LysR family transcriptional regulator [Gammaproteobacteria bacterium]|nr:LysR family transcriptional regulator [Gammaproteobacteria bacterium]
MKDSLVVGISRTEHIAIDNGRAISFLGEDLRTYSTPSMVRDIEYACLRLIQEHLGEGESSVGVRVEIDHLGATPMGQSVDITVTVREIDRRRVTFDAEVRDPLEVVGSGAHTRFVIDVARHQRRVEEKAVKLSEPT